MAYINIQNRKFTATNTILAATSNPLVPTEYTTYFGGTKIDGDIPSQSSVYKVQLTDDTHKLFLTSSNLSLSLTINKHWNLCVISQYTVSKVIFVLNFLGFKATKLADVFTSHRKYYRYGVGYFNAARKYQ